MDHKHVSSSKQRERPRLVLSLAAADKYGLSFCVGAVLALQELDLLAHTHSVAASGQCALLATWLCRLSAKNKWGGPEFKSSLLLWLREWCCESQEYAVFRSRLRRCSFRHFADPWLRELGPMLEQGDERVLSKPWHRSGKLDRPPQFYIGLAKRSSAKALESKVYYLCNSSTESINMPNHNVVVWPSGTFATEDFGHVLTSSLAPLGRFAADGLTVPISAQHQHRHASAHRVSAAETDSRRLIPEGAGVPQQVGLFSNLGVDALNIQLCNHVFMRARLNVMPPGFGATNGREPLMDLASLLSEDDLRDVREGKALIEETDRSEKLLLIDGFSNSLAYHTQVGTAARVKAAATVTEVVMGPVPNHEIIRAFRRSIVTLHCGEMGVDEALNLELEARGRVLTEDERLYHLQPERQLHEILLKLTGHRDGQLRPIDWEWAKTCANAGYIKTHKAFGDSGTVNRKLLFSEEATDPGIPYVIKRLLRVLLPPPPRPRAPR